MSRLRRARWTTRASSRPATASAHWLERAKLAAALGASSAYTDPGQALADPAVEAVVIAAPARFHADLIVAAAGAGKAVFCEKPAALSLP